MAERNITRAAMDLRRKLAARGSQAELARELSCEPSLVSRWLSGDRFPNAVQAAHIERRFGIRVAWWGQPAKPVTRSAAA